MLTADTHLAEISPARHDPARIRIRREDRCCEARSVAVRVWSMTEQGDAASMFGAIESKMWMPAYRELVPAHG